MLVGYVLNQFSAIFSIQLGFHQLKVGVLEGNSVYKNYLANTKATYTCAMGRTCTSENHDTLPRLYCHYSARTLKSAGKGFLI